MKKRGRSNVLFGRALRGDVHVRAVHDFRDGDAFVGFHDRDYHHGSPPPS